MTIPRINHASRAQRKHPDKAGIIAKTDRSNVVEWAIGPDLAITAKRLAVDASLSIVIPSEIQSPKGHAAGIARE